jgi:hypothetical protein
LFRLQSGYGYIRLLFYFQICKINFFIAILKVNNDGQLDKIGLSNNTRDSEHPILEVNEMKVEDVLFQPMSEAQMRNVSQVSLSNFRISNFV